jgi:hypothetical protein
MAKPQETFEEHWRARHRRGLEAAHRMLRAAFPRPGLFIVAREPGRYVQGCRALPGNNGICFAFDDEEDDEEDDYRVMDRWTDVFDRTWKREMRKNLFEAFDIALSSGLRAIGKPWPQETPMLGCVRLPAPQKVAANLRRGRGNKEDWNSPQ